MQDLCAWKRTFISGMTRNGGESMLEAPKSSVRLISTSSACNAGRMERTKHMRVTKTLPYLDLAARDGRRVRSQYLDGDGRALPLTEVDIAEAAGAESLADIDLERGDKPGLTVDRDAIACLDGFDSSAEKALLDDVGRAFELLCGRQPHWEGSRRASDTFFMAATTTMGEHLSS